MRILLLFICLRINFSISAQKNSISFGVPVFNIQFLEEKPNKLVNLIKSRIFVKNITT